MAARKPTFLFVLAVGLVWALTTDRAVAAIIVDDGLAGGWADASALLTIDQTGASAHPQTGTATPVSPALPPARPNPGDTPPRPRLAEGVLPGTGSAGNAGPGSQGGAPGTSSASLSGNLVFLPLPGLATRVPSEARPILPTGPPFELLRPPRGSA